MVQRLYGSYLSIIAQAKNVPNSREAWLVETHGGAGLHRSDGDPDGRRYGSALLACQAARGVQRRLPRFHAHVRAMEIKPEWALRLSQRVEEFKHGERPGDVVDVEVIPGDFADNLPAVLGESVRVRALSLWFVDPYGFKDIPFDSIAPLMAPQFGPEVLINLDLTGIWRKIGKPDEVADVNEVLYDQPDQQRALRALYGGDFWREALNRRQTYAESLRALAETYAGRFPRFQHRTISRLRSSDSQVRFLVHLAHSPTAKANFERCFHESLRGALLAGGALDPAARGQAAHSLFKVFRGQVTTLDELYEAGLMSLNRGQLRVVLREAELRGMGIFDEAGKVMSWAADQGPAQTSLPLDA